MLKQEPTFHDRQCKRDEVAQFTSSGIFEDITGALFTTNDLGQPAMYLIWFPILLSSSLNNTIASFQILVDGSPISMGNVFLKAKDFDVGYTLSACLEAEEAGLDLQVQWATDKGALTLSEYSFMIDGVPSSRVIV